MLKHLFRDDALDSWTGLFKQTGSRALFLMAVMASTLAITVAVWFVWWR